MANKPYLTGGIEPNLQEMIEDPIIQLLMRRDGVQKTDILQIVGLSMSAVRIVPDSEGDQILTEQAV